MSEANDILRSYICLVGRLSGADSVSLYVPPGAGGEREILIHEGRVSPLPELADAESAAEFHRRAGVEPVGHEDSAVRWPSREPNGILYRIPLRWVILRAEEEAAAGRRRSDGRSHLELAAWIGLRFEGGARRHEGAPWFPTAADTFNDERWWKGFLGLAAAFASHARAQARTIFDPVTGLPDRAEFQVELEAALVAGEEDKAATVLLLLGPDDFSWVNERLDRRSGDRVLREIAASLRAGLRSHDHVGRYGGAIFTVILKKTGVDDGRMVAENVVRRLSEQRYHGGILRLEFSAGVALGDASEPLDAQELIRR